MKVLLAMIFSLLWLAGAGAQSISNEQIARVDYEQRLGQAIPLNTEFRDDTGAPVRLGAFFGQKPVILALAYYECPNLCTIVLNGVLESTRNLKWTVGREFEVVVVSINPHEPTSLAHAKKQTYSLRYGRPGSASGWHFLTGEETAIRRLSEAVGFHYVYDPASKQYAHASGMVVLTPEGTVSRYFLGIEYPPKEVHAALADASQKKVGSLTQRLLLLCFHYDPKTGKHTLLISRVLQIGGIGTVLILAAVIVRLQRRGPTAALGLFPLLPESASNFAPHVDAIFFALLAVCGLLIVGIFATIVFCCIRYRADSGAPRVAPRGNTTAIEIGWTSVTLLIFLGIFFWAAVVYFRMSQPPANALEIHVVAKQWMWKVQHSDGRREINELHLLVNQPVKLLMTSQDVIHDFFVPAFRTKQDVLPSRYTMEWFTPTKPGRYRLYCAEYCGMDHSQMGGWVHVLDAAEYTRWQAGQPGEESIVAAGARLFVARGCSGCHTTGATVRAPLLNGIYGKPVALSDRSVVVADEQYLHDSILQPMKQITAGYDPVMPTYQGQLKEEEVMQLVAYLKTLGSSAAATP